MAVLDAFLLGPSTSSPARFLFLSSLAMVVLVLVMVEQLFVFSDGSKVSTKPPNFLFRRFSHSHTPHNPIHQPQPSHAVTHAVWPFCT